MRWLCLVIVAALAGCTGKPSDQPPRGPVLIHLSGIQGQSPLDKVFMERVAEDLSATPEAFRWTSPQRWMIGALQAETANRNEAKRLADYIADLHRSAPGRRIVLTAHSGGTGFAVFALEQLPEDVQVDALVMLAPAISSDYDLTVALRHVRREAYVFTSPYDRVVLGAGTRVFGTMDSQKVDSAGLVGFALPDGGDATQYAKVVQLDYQTSWLRYSHFGDHFGPLSASFADNIIGPLLATGMLPQ